MYAKDKILAYFLIYVGFAACKPWKEDKWDPGVSKAVKGIDIAMEYEAFQAATFGPIYDTTDISRAKSVKQAAWDRVQQGEATFTAILFAYAEESKTAGTFPSHLIPTLGRCGGVLITSDTLVTLCACVASFLTWMKTSQGQGDPRQDKNKIISDYDIPTKNIYVWQGQNTFKPWFHDWRIKLSTDPNVQIMNNDWCYEAIEKCTVKEHICQRANPAVLKFDLPWEYSAETLIPWPPSQFFYESDNGKLVVNVPTSYKEYLKAYHYSYVFKTTDDNNWPFYDEFGQLLDLGLWLLDWNKTLANQRECEILDDCLNKDKCKVANKWRLKDGITCFTGEKKPNICDGSFGSPVYASDFGLHGLAMSLYPCGTQTGRRAPSATLEVMAITQRMAEYIETLIPGLYDSSKEQMASHFLYRDPSDYKMYEIQKYKFEVHDEKAPSEVPHSDAVSFKPIWAMNALIFVLLAFEMVR